MQAHLSIRAHPRALRRIRRFVAGFGAARGIGRAEQARIAILLEELLTNLMKYGHLHRIRRRHVKLTLALAERRLAIEFSDDGPPFDPTAGAVSDLEVPLEERPLGQLGLHILRGLADEMRYSRTGGRNVIRLVRRIGPHRKAAPARIRQRRR